MEFAAKYFERHPTPCSQLRLKMTRAISLTSMAWMWAASSERLGRRQTARAQGCRTWGVSTVGFTMKHFKMQLREGGADTR